MSRHRVAFLPLSESEPMANRHQICARLNRSARLIPLEARQTPGLGGSCGMEMSYGDTQVHFFGARVTMQEFARALSRYGGYDHPIVDRTGLTGEFDVGAAASGDIVAPTRQARLLIALREQAGLTLRSEEGTYEVLRVRRIEQPSAN